MIRPPDGALPLKPLHEIARSHDDLYRPCVLYVTVEHPDGRISAIPVKPDGHGGEVITLARGDRILSQSMTMDVTGPQPKQHEWQDWPAMYGGEAAKADAFPTPPCADPARKAEHAEKNERLRSALKSMDPYAPCMAHQTFDAPSTDCTTPQPTSAPWAWSRGAKPARCNIVFHHDTVGSHGITGPHGYIDHFNQSTSVAVAVCETHGMQMPGRGPITTDALCPVGRIEQARDAAIAKINAAAGLFGPGTHDGCAS